jgi:hypothetical protein
MNSPTFYYQTVCDGVISYRGTPSTASMKVKKRSTLKIMKRKLKSLIDATAHFHDQK